MWTFDGFRHEVLIVRPIAVVGLGADMNRIASRHYPPVLDRYDKIGTNHNPGCRGPPARTNNSRHVAGVWPPAQLIGHRPTTVVTDKGICAAPKAQDRQDNLYQSPFTTGHKPTSHPRLNKPRDCKLVTSPQNERNHTSNTQTSVLPLPDNPKDMCYQSKCERKLGQPAPPPPRQTLRLRHWHDPPSHAQTRDLFSPKTTSLHIDCLYYKTLSYESKQLALCWSASNHAPHTACPAFHTELSDHLQSIPPVIPQVLLYVRFSSPRS